MSTDPEKQPSASEELVAMLKRVVSSDEPTAEQFAEIGENLVAVVKAALSGTK